METFFCAVAPEARATRAVLMKDGKVLNCFFSPAQEAIALEELSDFISYNLRNAGHFRSVVFTGYGHSPRWKKLRAFAAEHSCAYFLDILQGNDVQHILTLDAHSYEDPALRRLELIAHLCSRQRKLLSLHPPEKVLLEWTLNRSRDQILRIIDGKSQEDCDDGMNGGLTVRNYERPTRSSKTAPASP